MKVRYIAVLCCIFAVSCEALFGSLSEMNPDYCANRDSLCPAGMMCDEASHLCVPYNADGGVADGGNSDGGTSPGLSTELFGAEVTPIAKYNPGPYNEEGILYRGDFDGNKIDDLFIMGRKRYTFVNNLSTGAPVISSGDYLPVGKDPEAAAVGTLDGDSMDDVAIGLLTTDKLLVLMSKKGPNERNLPGSPRGVGIGDFDGDMRNDVAASLSDGRVVIFFGFGDDDSRTISNTGMKVIDPLAESKNHLVLRMIIPPYRNANGSHDIVLIYQDNTMGAVGSKARIIRFGSAASLTVDDIDIRPTPTDVAVGRFSSSTSYDLAIVVGEVDLDVIRSIEKPAPTKQQFSLNGYGVEATQPNRGKLATGQFLTASITGKLDDLAVLHKDGQVSIFPGGGSWSSGPSFLASRGMLGEHMVAGRFARNSQRDDLVVNTDTGVGANLMVARNLSGSQFTMPFDFHRDGTDGPNSIVIGGSFGAAGSSDFVLLGGSTANTAMRCGADGNQGIRCPLTKTISPAVQAAAPLNCAGQPTQLVVAHGDKSVSLVEMATASVSKTALGTTNELISQLEVGDVDNDGSPDVLARDINGSLSILLGTDGSPCQFSGPFRSPTTFAATLNLLASRKVLVTDA